MSDPALTRMMIELGLVEVEAEVIAREVAAGWSYPGASRPMHEWEHRGQVRFADLDRISYLLAGELGRGLESFVLDAMNVLDATVVGAEVGSNAELVAFLTGLTDRDLDLLEDRWRTQVEAAMIAAHEGGYGTMAGEAGRQGVDVDPHGDVTLDADTPGTTAYAMRQVAASTATAPKRALIDAALRVAEKYAADTNIGPDQVMVEVRDAVAKLTMKDVRDRAQQALNNAVASGRAAAAAAVKEPVEVYASELLDGATCSPCAMRDGRRYTDLAAAYLDYPGGGGFRDCLGGSRCRGTLVLVWEPEQAPTLDVGPLDRGTIDRTPFGPDPTPDEGTGRLFG